MTDLFGFLLLVSFICLVLSLIKPSIFNRFLKGNATRKKTGLIFGIAIIIFFLLIGITAEPTERIKETKEEMIEIETATATQQEEALEKEETQQELTQEPVPGQEPKQEEEVLEQEPTPEPETTSDEEKTDKATLGEKNALSAALGYLNYTSFSYSGLIEQLEYEGYTHKEAVYGADNCGADWNEQAVLTAEKYLDYGSFSRSGLIEQLEYEGFTSDQAEYGVKAVGY